VTDPIGPGNRAVKPELGEMTLPVVSQVANHLAKTGGKFTGTELVTIMAGGNDVLMQLGQLSAGATAAGTAAGQSAFPTLLIPAAWSPPCRPPTRQSHRSASAWLSRPRLPQAVTRPRSPPQPLPQPPSSARRCLQRRPPPPRPVPTRKRPAPRQAPTTPPPKVRCWSPHWARPAPNWLPRQDPDRRQGRELRRREQPAGRRRTPSGKAQSRRDPGADQGDGRYLQHQLKAGLGEDPRIAVRRPVHRQPRPGGQPGPTA
jgi:hypothetical protein